MIANDGNNYLVKFIKDVAFFNKSHLRNFFRQLPKNSFLIIDMTRPVFVDDDILDVIDEFRMTAKSMNIKIEIKRDSHNNFNTTKLSTR
jgi:MFS superfamily sulfate permease-like transporter